MNSNGFGFGLGYGLLLGYRPGFLYRPYPYTTRRYDDEHKGQNYNKRPDGLLECAIADTTTYIKKLSDAQDVESQEDSKVCASTDEVCYGKSISLFSKCFS